jgi:acetoin utilization deacetylase AcuC-like enzyme
VVFALLLLSLAFFPSVAPPSPSRPPTTHQTHQPNPNHNTQNSAHDPTYVAKVVKKSADASASVHRIGDESAFAPGGFEVAALSAGAALTATEAVLAGEVSGAYALSRPPGHHATRATGGGFCLFNNVAVSALHALEGWTPERAAERAAEQAAAQEAAAASALASPLSRSSSSSSSSSLLRHPHQSASQPSPPILKVAVVDFDVHHGNGTQDIFYNDDRVLTISLHQAGNYPLHEGGVDEVGAGRGDGHNINVPLPPGSGSGAYRAAFDRVVIPALDAYAPDLVLVSAGYDACYMDPLGQMMLGSHDYRYFMRRLRAAAARHSRGRRGVVAVHEGGYSDAYAPFCGLAAIEALCGAATRSRVSDPYWADVSAFGYQGLQPWQDAVLREVEEGPLRLLKARCEKGGGSEGGGGAARRRGAAAAAAAAAAAGLGGGAGRGRKAVSVPPPEVTRVAASVMGGRMQQQQQQPVQQQQRRQPSADVAEAAHG